MEKFFRANTPVKAIVLHQIRQYQKERREQISPTMKQPVTARSVNYAFRETGDDYRTAAGAEAARLRKEIWAVSGW